MALANVYKNMLFWLIEIDKALPRFYYKENLNVVLIVAKLATYLIPHKTSRNFEWFEFQVPHTSSSTNWSPKQPKFIYKTGPTQSPAIQCDNPKKISFIAPQLYAGAHLCALCRCNFSSWHKRPYIVAKPNNNKSVLSSNDLTHRVCVCACCEQTGLYSSVVPLRHVNSWASGFMTNPRWHYWLEVSDGGKSFKIDGILRTLTVFLLLQASVIILESVSPSCYLSYQLKLTWAR